MSNDATDIMQSSNTDNDMYEISPVDGDSDLIPDRHKRMAVEVAHYLLDQKLYLSALEYHFEQMERGQNLSVLRSFFENTNFCAFLNTLPTEPANNLVPYPSISTLDSLDIGRLSDDGNALEEKLKVLEYELRKKNEEIKNLRSELTNYVTGGSDPNEMPIDCEETYDPGQMVVGKPLKIQPHELRALAILVNEFLLSQNYQLTAIQFAEEIEAVGLHDLESWDLVGINIAKPIDLVHLLRFYWFPTTQEEVSISKTTLDATTQTEQEQPNTVNCYSHVDDLSSILESGTIEIASLNSKIANLESKNSQLSKQAQDLRNQLICLEREHAEIVQNPSSTRKCIHCNDSSSVLATSSDKSDDAKTHDSHTINYHPTDALSRRLVSDGFLRYTTQILPLKTNLATIIRTFEGDNFRLAESLDDFVVCTASCLESVISTVNHEHKTLECILPLLTQTICLHPSPATRDRLLRTLFTTFCPDESSTDFRIHSTLKLLNPTSESTDLQSNSARQSLMVLLACRLLASYLGPARLESELLPQIWSLLNELPTSRFSRRFHLIAACGVIAPFIPDRLRSSLMLSILESNLDVERSELVHIACIRSLTCLVSLISDQNKLAQLIKRFRILVTDNYDPISDLCSTNLGTMTKFVQCPITTTTTTTTTNTNTTMATTTNLGSHLIQPHYLVQLGGPSRINLPVGWKVLFTTGLNWFLPSLAQWCLELDLLETSLLEPWLEKLDSFVQINSAEKIKPHPNIDQVVLCLNVLGHCVPFLHAWLLITLVQKSADHLTCWSSIHQYLQQEIDLKEDEDQNDKPVDYVDVTMILGQTLYQTINPLFQGILSNTTSDKPASDATPPLHEKLCPMDTWKAKLWLDQILLPKLVLALEQIPYNRNLNQISMALFDLDKETQFLDYCKQQFNDCFGLPCQESLESNSFIICLNLCRLLVRFGQSLGPQAIHSLIAPPFKSKLMKKTSSGNFEYDHTGIQTGLLAGYCCLLSSSHLKSELSQVKMLLTSAIFLHCREAFSLESIKLTIWCLCFTANLDVVIQDLLLPALRPCVSCADSTVRRSVAHLLQSTIQLIHFLGAQSSDQSNYLDPNLLDQLWSFVGQVARDDVTGQRKCINPDEADWSVLCVSLGPLYSFHKFLASLMLNSANLSQKPIGSDMSTSGMSTVSSSILFGSDQSHYRDMFLDVLNVQMDLVVGRSSTTSLASAGVPVMDYTMDRLIISQCRFWSTLVHGLLDLINQLLPTCDDMFRQKAILPWLFNLAEMNNALPNLEQRMTLADHLITVFSTAAFSIHHEQSILTWLLPGLDRVRLDLVESGNTTRIREVEQFLTDLNVKLGLDSSRENLSKRNTNTSFNNNTNSPKFKLRPISKLRLTKIKLTK